MQKTSFYIINAITVYRMAAAFFLLYLIIKQREDLFKWLLAFSFFTDAIDGFLARRYKVVSVMGARIDSLADDLTMLMAIIGIIVFEPGFLSQEHVLVTILIILYLVQMGLAFIRYGSVTSFHTYLAKLAALAQGIFLILLFFLPRWPTTLFYIAAAVTILDVVEEIILVILLPKWQSDVKGIYWVKKKRVAGNMP